MYTVQIVAGFNKIVEIEIKETANVCGYGQCRMLNSAKLFNIIIIRTMFKKNSRA